MSQIEARRGARPKSSGHLLLRRGSLPDPLATPRRRPRPPLTSPSLSGPPSPSLLCFHPMTESRRRRRSQPPWPPATPRPVDKPRRTTVVSCIVYASPFDYGSPASPPTPSPPSPAARDRRRPLATSDVSPEPLGLQSTPCKPRHRSPLPPFSFAHPGRRFHQGRNPPPHELDAGVTPVTIWSCTSVQRTRGCTQSMASALAGSFARCITKPATHPSAGRRPNARRRRSRPPHAQPPAPLDAEHSKLSVEPSRAPNRRRTAISEARRRVLWSPATHRRRI